MKLPYRKFQFRSIVQDVKTLIKTNFSPEFVDQILDIMMELEKLET